MVAGIKLIYSLAFGSLQRYPRELGLFDLRFESSLPDKKGLRFVNCPPSATHKKRAGNPH